MLNAPLTDPRGPAANAAVPALKIGARAGQGGRRSRVIVAEDDEDQREAIAAALRSIDIDVDLAEDGGRFLVAVASQYRAGAETCPIDLMVVDVIMPVCSGLAIVEALRKAHWVTPIVVITGRETREIRDATDRLRTTLMIKPLRPATLQQTVLRLLGGQ